MKTCRCCHQDKPEQDFPEFVKTYVARSGEVRKYVLRRNKCKSCVSKYMRPYMAGRKNLVLAY